MIVDNFLDDFPAFNRHARSVDYSGVVNPVDGVLYPDISTDIPDDVRADIQDKLSAIMGYEVEIKTLFMRLTSKNTKGAPHQAHTDTVMGHFTLLLYMNDGPGGTSFVRHKETGMDSDPRNDAEYAIWRRDTNVPDAWEPYEMVSMRENRANIISSGLMHRAEPVNGFGESVEDGRLVLTAFFS